MTAPSFPLTLALAALVAGTVGCATQQTDRARSAQRALVGMSKSALLDCAGTPQSVRGAQPVEYLTYSSDPRLSGTNYGPSSELGSGDEPRYRGIDQASDIEVFDQVRSDYCEARFTIVNDRVDRVDYRTQSGLSTRRYDQCYNIVSGCLNRVVPTDGSAEQPAEN